MADQRINRTAVHDYYNKITVTRTTFGTPTDGYAPDVLIPFVTQSVIMLNEDDTDIVEYSFDGYVVHGELNPTLPTRGLVFDNRVICKVWLRLKSAGSAVVRIDAWQIR